ncbi:MAG: hypothetical protein KKH68_02125 [Proteobacteria bacterium]|nr:hypothetical protein [Pseudomonadota bacterium]
MDLLKDIRQKRSKQRQKQPIRQGVFNQISGIVTQYGLKNNFLSVLENIDDYLSNQHLNASRVRVKAPMESPLFSLATKDEYALTISIISKIDNPYLKFAHSPEEIILCVPLYRLNPALHPEKLRRYHFETLILHERTKANREI